MREIKNFKSLLHSKFDMKDLNHVKKILVMRIHKNRKKCASFVNKYSFIMKVLTKFFI